MVTGALRDRWQAFGGTARGALHLQTGQPNQDAFAIGSGMRGDSVAVAVADGHGDPRCVRADVGARLAVAAAIEGALAFCDGASLAATGPEEVHILAESIAAEWRAAVHEHAATHPWQAHESRATNGPVDTALAYGCTLLLAVVTETLLVCAQIGDGDILVVRDGGDTSRPVAQRGGLVGGQTLSLATQPTGAAASVALTQLDDDVRMLLLATDGYANSFATSDWDVTIGRDYVGVLAERGADWMAAALPGWAQASADAAGDDVTVLVLARR